MAFRRPRGLGTRQYALTSNGLSRPAYNGHMSITVEELAGRLNAEAARRGVSVDTLLDELADKLPPQRQLGFVSLGASSTGRTAREADEMLAEGFGQS